MRGLDSPLMPGRRRGREGGRERGTEREGTAGARAGAVGGLCLPFPSSLEGREREIESEFDACKAVRMYV